MVKSSKRTPALFVPQVFTTPGVKEGVQVAVHAVRENQEFVQLSFKEKFGPTQMYDLEAIVNYDINKFKQNKIIVAFFEGVEKTILNLGGIYSSYNYLFTIIKGKPYLLSVSVSNVTLGFSTVKEIAVKLGVNVLNPTWTGLYTFTTWAVFYENIFIQVI